MIAYNFVVSEPIFSWFNAGEIVLFKAVYSLSISLSVSKTSAFKLKSFLNHAEFWTFFAFQNFKRAVPPNLVHKLSCLDSNTSSAKVSLGYTP